ncbi:MAG: hypothetical protein GY730_03030 [bacterium]|nr:hypothetical protein [bacterium]
MNREEIANKLKDKGATKACHRCNKNHFSVLDGYSNLILQDDLSKGLVIGGPSVPVALLACNNCGAITSHALGALGLLKDKEDKSNG